MLYITGKYVNINSVVAKAYLLQNGTLVFIAMSSRTHFSSSAKGVDLGIVIFHNSRNTWLKILKIGFSGGKFNFVQLRCWLVITFARFLLFGGSWNRWYFENCHRLPRFSFFVFYSLKKIVRKSKIVKMNVKKTFFLYENAFFRIITSTPTEIHNKSIILLLFILLLFLSRFHDV